MSDQSPSDLVAAAHRAATEFGDPVLTYLDTDGYPASVRVKVSRADHAADGLDVRLPQGAPAPADGPANLLAHSHTEELWDLQQTMVRGRLGVSDGTARFLPARVVVGARAGLLAGLKVVRRCRRTAARELERRGLARPSIRWDAVKRISDRASASDERR